MVEYEALKLMFDHLKVENMPKKHWSDAYGWESGKYENLQVLKTFKGIMIGTKYFSIASDKVTSIDNKFDGYLFTSMW
jgi:hypothetical protein